MSFFINFRVENFYMERRNELIKAADKHLKGDTVKVSSYSGFTFFFS